MTPEDDLAEFLDNYADACAVAGVEPLPLAAVAELAKMLLTATGLTEVALH